jgi:membrane associated rhomboid family serine protease
LIRFYPRVVVVSNSMYQGGGGGGGVADGGGTGGAHANPGARRASTGTWLFSGAPVTQVLTSVVVASYFLVHTLDTSNAATRHQVFRMDSQRLNPVLGSGPAEASSQLYRYISSKVLFGTNGELIMGTIVLTWLGKRMERELGSKRFFIVLSLVNTVTGLLEFAVLVPYFGSSSGPSSSHYVYSGPYPVLGAIALWYHVYTPKLYPRFVGAFQVQFSDKIMWYATLGQLLYAGSHWYPTSTSTSSRTVGTLLAAASGAFICYAYLQSSPRIKSMLDAVISTPMSYLESLGVVLPTPSSPPPLIFPSGRILTDIPPPAGAAGGMVDALAAEAALGGGPHANGAAATTTRRGPAAPAPPPPAFVPNEQAAASLVAMGFPLSRVHEALQLTNNNVEQAAEYLLTA